MSPFTFVNIALVPGLSLLPAEMDSPQARAMVLAICLQESGLQHRRQMGDGPARSYAQFEPIGVVGVLLHPRTKAHADAVCRALDIPPTPASVIAAIEYSDVLCVAFTRLLLWTLPDALPPDEHAADAGWKVYLRSWRPGKPRPERWAGSFGVAWDLVKHDGNELPNGRPRSSWGHSVPSPTGQ